ncbi:hypothetical protein [Pedobacter nutrimenti]|uniref:YD repeat-containing protein n=1 Tax=Pedobacter nutrimenti TaxID=1241337 RepID=A0A318UJV1_9SPHI|nr:hypothetical protein [Pedobacter nutrimenti]PYF74245.1 YD repeat-containing protein [Pedobacter nutrimenti]
MHKKLIILFGLMVVAISTSFSQGVTFPNDKSNVTFPSPTAASLGKYGEYPVSLYSGQINIDVPLLEINSGKLSLPISLSYNGSGNKPSDIPGWVGLGWSLNAGGVITRIVKNLPDDLQFFGYYYDKNVFNAQLALSEPDPNYCYETIYRRHDLEPDIFLFNFAGHTGKFHFDNHGIPRVESAEKLKIEVIPTNDVLAFFDAFVVTTLDGTKYRFDHKEWGLSGLTFPENSENHVSSWYLTKIENLTGDVITFKYTLPEAKYRFRERSYDKVTFLNSGIGQVAEEGRVPSLIIDQVTYLDEIVFSNGKLKFPKSIRTDFSYKPAPYASLTAEEKKLDNITLYDKSEIPIKKWDFHYIENIGRLKIDSIKESSFSGGQKKVYRFEYNSDLLPTSSAVFVSNDLYNSNDIDHWGYYNAANNDYGRVPITFVPKLNDFIGTANRTAHPRFMKAEMLEKIHYPTGGYTKFEFEPNDYSEQQSGPIEANYEWTEYSFFYESGSFDVDPNTIEIKLDEPTVVQSKRSAINIGPNRQWLPSGSESLTYTLPKGTHTLASIFRTNELLNNGNSDVQTAAGSLRLRKKITSNPYFSIGGGLRIKSVENFDGKDIVKKEYEYKAQNPIYSSGVLSGFPTYFRDLQTIWLNLKGYVVSSESLEELPYGPSVVYKRVAEKLSDGSKIVHNYTSFSEFPDQQGTSYSWVETSMRHPISYNDLRGLEKGTEFYSSSGKKVKEIFNTYTIHPEGQVHIPAIDNKIIFRLRLFSEMLGLQGLPTTVVADANTMSKYTIPSRFVYKQSSREITYTTLGTDPVTIQTDYSYDNPQHFQVTKINSNNSKGELLQKKQFYPHDMISLNRDPNGIYLGMVNQNNISPVIETVGAKNSVQTSLIRNNYYQPFNGVFLPKTIEVQQKDNDPVETEKVYRTYDVKGNPLSIAKNNGPETNYLWSYGGQFPIAEIKNTDYISIENVLGASNIQAFSNSNPSDIQIKTFLSSLRTSLPNAFITAYTYNPLVGITSSTDPKGMTIYYEYDEFQRLKNVKDQDGNIIKNTTYHYKP